MTPPRPEGKRFRSSYEMGKAEGYAAAIADAVKIAEGRKFYDPEGYLAQAIRNLLPKGTK